MKKIGKEEEINYSMIMDNSKSNADKWEEGQTIEVFDEKTLYHCFVKKSIFNLEKAFIIDDSKYLLILKHPSQTLKHRWF